MEYIEYIYKLIFLDKTLTKLFINNVNVLLIFLT